MSAEPDTRPFTSAELAHFLEQFELDRPAGRSSVVAARAPRIVGTEPRTMLGMGGLPRCAADSSLSASPWRAAQLSEHRPGSVLGHARSRAELACAALIATSLIVALCWGVAIVAGPPSAPITIAAPGRLHRAPPPLPQVVAHAAERPARAEQTLPAAHHDEGTRELVAAQAPGPASRTDLALASAHSEVATSTTRATTQQLAPAQRAAPLGRVGARRDAVDLLLSGHTRAALATYRELPPALRAEPALSEVIRLLERELRACDARAGVACGT